MKIPPLLIGAVCLFWGLETDRLLIGLILGLVIEGNLLVKTKYDLDEDDFVKISDLTSLLFIGSVALILLNNEPTSFLRITTGWVPVIFAPLILAQLYSTGNTITIGTRLGKGGKSYTHKPIDFRIYYILNCIFAAATGNSRSALFYIMLCGILAVLLWNNRGRAYRPTTYLLLFCFASLSGYAISAGMEKSYHYVMQNSFRLLHRYYRSQMTDPYKAHVNFGDTGRLKYSGKIIMRIEAEADVPALFREASYTSYRKGNWFGNQGEFELLVPVEKEVWQLEPKQPEKGQVIQVEYDLPKEKGLLPYPAGSFKLSSPTIFELEQHRNGTIKIVDAAPVASYDLFFQPHLLRTGDTPRGRNLVIPPEETYALEEVAAKLSYATGSVQEKIHAIENFLGSGFTYSLNLIGSGEFATPLGNFLLQRKSGFCEYYATATALLLRYVGVPSRYSVGYAVREFSTFEGKFVVRNRHAHAWAEAYVDGRWQVVDTTPPDWFKLDAEKASGFESVKDLINLLSHKYKLFQIGSGRDYTLAFSILVVVLTAFLVIRIYRRMKLQQADTGDSKSPERTFERIETPLTPLLDQLVKFGVKRLGGESFASWAMRCYRWQHFNEDELNEMYSMHLQLRFDPRAGQSEIAPRLALGVSKYSRQLELIQQHEKESEK